MTNPRITYHDMLNPLSIHPSDGLNSIQIDKREGTADYRSWKRSMKINLASKRKLGFVTGIVPKPTDDVVQTELWETCNHMVKCRTSQKLCFAAFWWLFGAKNGGIISFDGMGEEELKLTNIWLRQNDRPETAA